MAERKARGCFFWGTITMVLVIIGVMVGLYFGTRKAIQVAVTTYTAAGPAQIPTLEITPAEEGRIIEEIGRETQAAIEGRGNSLVELDEREVNVLLRQAPRFENYSNQIYLDPEGEQLKAHLSVPLDQFQHWKDLGRKIGSNLGGRYFNGNAVLNVGVTNGMLHVAFAELEVNGQILPGEFTGRIQGQNLAKDANENPEAQAVLQRMDRIEVQDGKLRLHFKQE